MVLITSLALSLLSLRTTPCITILQKKKHISVMTEFKAHALILCTVLPFGILAIRKKPVSFMWLWNDSRWYLDGVCPYKLFQVKPTSSSCFTFQINHIPVRHLKKKKAIELIANINLILTKLLVWFRYWSNSWSRCYLSPNRLSLQCSWAPKSGFNPRQSGFKDRSHCSLQPFSKKSLTPLYRWWVLCLEK